VIQDPKEKKVREETKVRPDLKGRKETKETKVIPDLKGRKVRKVIPDPRVQLDYPDHPPVQ